MAGVEQNRYKTNNGCFKHLPQTGMYANSMHINKTNYKYTLNIDSLPYRNTISFGLFSNSVRNKCLGSNVPTNAA